MIADVGGLVLLARLLLAATFVVAGVTKLADLPGSRKAIVNFGLPGILAGPLGVGLPAAELLLAACLLPVLPAWIGGTGALLLLLIFILGISINLIRGRTPDCHCFGQVHSEPIGWPTLLRNLALAALAGFLAWQGRTSPGPTLIAWATGLTAFEQVALAIGLIGLTGMVVEGWFLVLLFRQQRALLRLHAAADGNFSPIPSQHHETQPAGLPVHSRAPDFRLDRLDASPIALEELLAADKPVLLVFMHPGCGPCQILMPEVARWQREHGEDLAIAVVSEGSIENNRAKRLEFGFNQVLIQKDREVAEAYHAQGTPAAVIIRPDGTIGSQLALGPGPIWELMAHELGVSSTSKVIAVSNSGFAVGAQAPGFRLRGLDGETWALEHLLQFGRPVIMLFLDPDWPPSTGLAPELAAWQRQYERQLTFVIISVGSAEQNREVWSEFGPTKVLVQKEREVTDAYHVPGTPAALVVLPDGRIGSPLALGAAAIRALVRQTCSISLVPTGAES